LLGDYKEILSEVIVTTSLLGDWYKQLVRGVMLTWHGFIHC